MRMRIGGGEGILVLALVLVVGGVSACGSRAVGDERATAVEAGAVTARLDALTEAGNGSAGQRAAAEFRITYALNAPTASCMAAGGFAWRWQYVNLHAGRDYAGLGGMSWISVLGGRRVSSGALASRRASVQVTAFSEQNLELIGSQGASYRDALRRCSGTQPDTAESAAQAYDDGAPSRLAALVEDLARDVDSELDATYAGPYRTCMSDAGVELPTEDPEELIPVEGYLAARAAGVARQPGSEEVPLPGESPTEVWSDFLAFEERVMSADASCRTPAFTDGMTRLGPRLDRFEREHPGLEAAARSSWAGDVTWAVAHGYDPSAERYLSPDLVAHGD